MMKPIHSPSLSHPPPPKHQTEGVLQGVLFSRIPNMKYCPPNRRDDICLGFCPHSSSMSLCNNNKILKKICIYSIICIIKQKVVFLGVLLSLFQIENTKFKTIYLLSVQLLPHYILGRKHCSNNARAKNLFCIYILTQTPPLLN